MIAQDLTESARALDGKSPEAVLEWATERFSPKIAMATAFGAEGCCLVAMLAKIGRPVRIFNLDTDYQFEETLDTRRRLIEKYGVAIESVHARQSKAEIEAAHGPDLWKRDTNLCCRIRKVEPLRETVAGSDAWISAIRRDQTPDRAQSQVVEWDAKFELVKVNPLLHWTWKNVWSYIHTNDVPYNPLHDRGYPSIGCWPCTRPVQDGEDPRAGRWNGEKKECGLHSRG
ncbi:MAG: phosphoadenylyl-sulfate reductase [Planctomycetes bacterium]|nr:phosphoadenylyl-sulfate reductase [Planctomycetota bacterium]